MNEILKQRLVGALILIALGVVFWPIIFVQPGDTTAGTQMHIPPRPGVNTNPIAAPHKKGLRQSPELESRKEAERQELARETAATVKAKPIIKVKPADVKNDENAGTGATTKNTAASKQKTRTEAPEKPVLDSEGIPVAWILQVASVSSSEKAEELRAQLLAMGHKAYVKKIHRSGKTLLRIYIGPKFERARLDKIRPGVDSEFGVQSIIVRYIP